MRIIVALEVRLAELVHDDHDPERGTSSPVARSGAEETGRGAEAHAVSGGMTRSRATPNELRNFVKRVIAMGVQQ